MNGKLGFFLILFLLFPVFVKLIELFSYDFCYAPKCVVYFSERVWGAFQYSAYFATAVGVVALIYVYRSYEINRKDSAFSNHVKNYEIFIGFIENSFHRFSRVSRSSIDVYKIYTFLFPLSREGQVTGVSKEFVGLLDDLDGLIAESNRMYEEGKFNFLNHQRKMAIILGRLDISITVERERSRMEYLEAEKDVIEFIMYLYRFFSSDSARGLSNREYFDS